MYSINTHKSTHVIEFLRGQPDLSTDLAAHRTLKIEFLKSVSHLSVCTQAQAEGGPLVTCITIHILLEGLLLLTEQHADSLAGGLLSNS